MLQDLKTKRLINLALIKVLAQNLYYNKRNYLTNFKIQITHGTSCK